MGKDTLKVGIAGSRKYENRQKIKEFIFKLKNDKGTNKVNGAMVLIGYCAINLFHNQYPSKVTGYA